MPIPPFLLDHGQRLPGDDWTRVVNGDFCSPAALNYADAAMKHLVEHGRLDDEDARCLELIWRAARAGLKPTKAQQRQYDMACEFEACECVRELYADVELSQREFKDAIMCTFRLSDDAFDKMIARRRAAYEACFGVRKSP